MFDEVVVISNYQQYDSLIEIDEALIDFNFLIIYIKYKKSNYMLIKCLVFFTIMHSKIIIVRNFIIYNILL